jgi:hypothetical protein
VLFLELIYFSISLPDSEETFTQRKVFPFSKKSFSEKGCCGAQEPAHILLVEKDKT